MPYGIDNDGNGEYDTDRNPDQGANETQQSCIISHESSFLLAGNGARSASVPPTSNNIFGIVNPKIFWLELREWFLLAPGSASAPF
jgi:hypothetical protein